MSLDRTLFCHHYSKAIGNKTQNFIAKISVLFLPNHITHTNKDLPKKDVVGLRQCGLIMEDWQERHYKTLYLQYTSLKKGFAHQHLDFFFGGEQTSRV